MKFTIADGECHINEYIELFGIQKHRTKLFSIGNDFVELVQLLQDVGDFHKSKNIKSSVKMNALDFNVKYKLTMEVK